MDEGAVERRHAGHARVHCAISISGSGECVSLRLTVDQERPEQGQQERGAWRERVLTMHAMASVYCSRYFIITPSNGNTMSQFQPSHTKRGLNLQEKVEA